MCCSSTQACLRGITRFCHLDEQAIDDFITKYLFFKLNYCAFLLKNINGSPILPRFQNV
jgi:hypothetical protein